MKSGYDDIMEKALLYSTTVSLSRQRLRIKGVVNLSAWNQHGKYMCSIRYFCIGEEEEEVAGWLDVGKQHLGSQESFTSFVSAASKTQRLLELIEIREMGQ